ncbi:glutamate synthase subunit beta [candidate division KSB1 bacterium]|nr:glutamate synthase subunit beta [candidate division KSB1 bacterium]
MINKQTGFITFKREDAPKRPVDKRILDYKEFELSLPEDRLRKQAARCMDCGVPFCHSYGCPVKNLIPDWNDMVFKGQWKRALDLLHETINFPEFTGRVCPAPCETSCTLAINQPAVTIRQIELQIVERGWRDGIIQPERPPFKTGRRIAVIGSGPAGLAAAQQLARKGHRVIVLEKSDRIGGLLRYGIPDFKLEKWVIDRRLEQMSKEGVIFETEVKAGTDLAVRYMRRTFDAIVITTGSIIPRDLNVPGRELPGIHFAMDFLVQQNKRNAGDEIPGAQEISAKGKNVVVIGGGDTGSDCVGTAKRQGAKSITQIELLPKPPMNRELHNPWPIWPTVLRTSSSHEEGCTRDWSIMTKGFIGTKNGVKKIKAVKLEWSAPDANSRQTFKEIPNSEFEINADLVLLAMGFVHPEQGPLIENFELKVDERNNIVVDENMMTSIPGVFGGGDCVMGASLIVKSIFQGRQAASGVHKYLMNL